MPAAAGEGESEVPYETAGGHHQNFIEAVKKRVDPVVPVEIGHSSCTVCTLGNIACELGRPVKWDPKTQTFVDDADGAAAERYRTNDADSNDSSDVR